MLSDEYDCFATPELLYSYVEQESLALMYASFKDEDPKCIECREELLAVVRDKLFPKVGLTHKDLIALAEKQRDLFRKLFEMTTEAYEAQRQSKLCE